MVTIVNIRAKSIRGPAMVFPSQKISWMSSDRRQGLFWELPGGQSKNVINNDPQDSLSNNSRDERHPTVSGAQKYCVIISAILFRKQLEDQRLQSGAQAGFLEWRRYPQISNCLQTRREQDEMACTRPYSTPLHTAKLPI